MTQEKAHYHNHNSPFQIQLATTTAATLPMSMIQGPKDSYNVSR
jgi:hypothetical protein